MTVAVEREHYGPTPVPDPTELPRKEAEVERLVEAAIGSATVHCDLLDALRRARADLNASRRRLGTDRPNVPKLAERAARDGVDSYRFRQLIARWREHTALDW